MLRLGVLLLLPQEISPKIGENSQNEQPQLKTKFVFLKDNWEFDPNERDRTDAVPHEWNAPNHKLLSSYFSFLLD